MIGDLASDQEKGLIPRIGVQLFKEIQHKKEEQQHQNSSFSIKVSYCEIYQERVRDLLTEDLSPRRKSCTTGGLPVPTEEPSRAQTSTPGPASKK